MSEATFTSGVVTAKLKSKTSGNPLARFKNGQAVNLLEGQLASFFNYAVRDVWKVAGPKVHEFMRDTVYPSYDPEVGMAMDRSIDHRFDRRRRGATLTLELDHPLLYARENGQTVTGATEFKSVSGKPMRVPLSRVLASQSFMGISQKKINDAIAYYRHAKSQGEEKGSEPAIFFTRAKVGRAPFMADIEEIIMESARDLMAETMRHLPADAIGKAFNA